MRQGRGIRFLAVAALVAICCTGTAIAAGSSSSSRTTAAVKLGGKWKGQYSGAVSGHFTLHWKRTGTRLHGTISLSNPKGRYSVGGSVHGKKIKFGAVGVGARYKGSVHGAKMSGTWTSGQGGGSWSAHKAR